MEASSRGLLDTLSRHFHGETEENSKYPRIAGVLFEIQTEYHLNKSRERYR
jgi:hypothetical protein